MEKLMATVNITGITKGKEYEGESTGQGYMIVNDFGIDTYYNGNTFFIIEQNCNYMVYVEGKSFPKRKHTIESAKKEAERLCLKEGRKTYIVQIAGGYEIKANYFNV